MHRSVLGDHEIPVVQLFFSIKITQLTFFPQGWLFLLNTKSRNNVLKQFFEHILYLFSSFRRKPFENCPGKIINQS